MRVWAKGARFPPMTALPLSQTLRLARPGPAAQLFIGLGLALGAALAVIGPDRLLAQIEGDRGILPVATSTDIEIDGIAVETTGKDAQEARLNGWKLAQREAWKKLGGPDIPDAQIEGMVSAVIVEREQIGPKRYIARLGVVFDRERAGKFLVPVGSDPTVARSAPLLVIPLLYSGGTAQVFEVRGPWQNAWANFRTGASPIDYVRPVGSGGDSLLITAGQPSRRSRLWWRNVLDQYAAADVLIPIARLERQSPGGPVKGKFTARYGPDNRYLDSFSLIARDEQAVPAMLNQALVRLDLIYRAALARGELEPDPTLVADTRAIDAAIAALVARAPVSPDAAALDPSADTPSAQPSATPAQAVVGYTVQFASPDGQSVDTTVAVVRSVPGVQGAATSSIAIGGTSVMRVSYAGDINALAAALRTRGWQVTVGSNALSIRR